MPRLLPCRRGTAPGVSIERLSRQTGRDRRVLRRVLTEAAVPLRTRHPLPVEQTEWITTQYQQGGHPARPGRADRLFLQQHPPGAVMGRSHPASPRWHRLVMAWGGPMSRHVRTTRTRQDF